MILLLLILVRQMGRLRLSRYPVKLIQIKPSEFGFSYALNLGIKKSKGKYIGILSGHSVPVNNTWLENGMKVIKEKNMAGITGYYTSAPLGYYSRFLGSIFFLPMRKRLDRTPWLTNTNSLIKKDLWKKYPFDEKLEGCEDFDWASEMLARGHNIVKLRSFSVFHSHELLGRPGYFRRTPRWKRICAVIDKRKRPRESYTRLKL